jgi:DNA mismatch repair protein MutS
MRQYVEQKQAVPDALLLFRMGDFYELFYDDAVTAARTLGLTLTSRSKGDSAIPLAGIPYHALESYLVKLVHAGFKVAISEQVEDPRQAKGVVRRDIVRIVTPGTLTEDSLLQQGSDNSLACLCGRGGESGLACVELSTGAFWAQTGPLPELLDEIVRLAPAEMLVPEARIDCADPLADLLASLQGPGSLVPGLLLTRRPARLFEPYQAREALLRQFAVATLEGFGFQEVDASLCCAAAIVDYLAETQKTSLQHLTGIWRRVASDYVLIDRSTCRALEIERTVRGGGTAGTLVEAVDRTSTPMGARCLRRWLAAPLAGAAAIRERHAAIACLLASRGSLQGLRRELAQLADIERITSRLGVNRASPRDLLVLGRALLAVDRVADLMDQGFGGLSPLLPDDARPVPDGAGGDTPAAGAAASSGELPPFLAQRANALRGQRRLGEFLTAALHPEAPLVLSDGDIIAPGHDAELDRLRSIGTDGRQWLAEYQAREIERTGIPTLKVGFNQVFGYYLEVTHTHRDRVPADYVRKQTVKNAERYITDELKRHETEVLTARDRAIAREIELFEAIRRHAAEHIPALQKIASAAGEIDVAAGWAHLADERRYTPPEIVEEAVLEIVDGRHPVLEQTLAEKFVPNDCRLAGRADAMTEGVRPTRGRPRASRRGTRTGQPAPGPDLFGDGSATACAPDNLPVASGPDAHGESLIVLTGPNMAGKSTYIRQVALLTLLAQAGSYVPAGRMRLGPVDRIFARIGASDEIARGQSTFMVEMTEAANILNNATPRSLVIIDELGRGTSTFDGLSLAWAIAEHLVTHLGCRSLFATHYHELTQLERYLEGVSNFNVAVREWQDQIVFLHRIVRGGTDKSYGVHVAKLAGVPPEVIHRSRELLAELEADFASARRSPARAARSTKRDERDQPGLFMEPTERMDAVIEAVRQFDVGGTRPVDALQAIEEWQRRLKE